MMENEIGTVTIEATISVHRKHHLTKASLEHSTTCTPRPVCHEPVLRSSPFASEGLSRRRTIHI
jgi:hypothetical protein